ncbi:MAG: hypothetical protein INR71_08740, partial [Terriglobus roseus]|nr:hypothetical protein [Terriglobus roseus]
MRDLNSFTAQAGASVTPSARDRDAVPDTDLDGYIASLRHQSTLDLIQEGLEQSKRDFDTFLEENVQLNWDLQRRKIYEHFGLVKRDESLEESIARAAADDDTGAFGRSSKKGRAFGKSSFAASGVLGASSMARSVIGTPKAGNGRASVFGADAEKAVPSVMQGGAEDRFQRERQQKLADKVKYLNVSRIRGEANPILHSFRAVESESGLDTAQPIVQSYEALVAMTGEPPEPLRTSDPAALKERCFRDSYRDEGESPNSARALEMRKRILNGSRKLLERQFYRSLTSAVDKNPREANVGGIPGKLDRIRGYVRLLVARKELGTDVSQLQQVGDDYCFAVVFFLLRSGLLKEAQNYTESIKRALQHIDRNFARYVACYAQNADRRLPPDLQQRITTEYHGQMKIAPETSIDPYRMACYKVLGRCELGRRSLEGISAGWEDYFWLQFSLAREQNRAETSAGETFGLEQLREEVDSIGERHFPAGQSNSEMGGYGMYFFLQIIVGLYEKAVDWLYKHDYVAAVHFAIALDYY